jgi:hypothetical protein
MSKEVKFTAKIKNADQKTLDAAIQNIVKSMNAQIMTEKSFHIYGTDITRKGMSIKLPNMCYPVDIYIEDGQIKLHGDEMDMHTTSQVIEQFYKITYMQQQVQTLAPNLNGLRTDINYDKNKEKARLEVAWF